MVNGTIVAQALQAFAGSGQLNIVDVNPEPLVSRDLPATDTLGFTVTTANDADYSTVWRSGTVPGPGVAAQSITYDVHTIPNRTRLVAHWRSDHNNNRYYNPTSPKSIPTDYDIQGNRSSGDVLGSGTFAKQNNTRYNQLGPDGYSWAQTSGITVDKYGKLVALNQLNAGGGHIWVWSNDAGATWEETATPYGALQRGSVAYDSTNDIFHVLWACSSGDDGALYRRYTATRDGSHNITDMVRDTSINLQLEADATINITQPVLLWLNDAAYGTYGALVAMWACANATQGQIHGSMRILSNTTGDNTASNWTRLDGGTTSDSGLLTSTYLTPITAVSAAVGAQLGVSATRKRIGTHALDLYVAYAAAGDVTKWRRFPWQSGTHNWGTPTTATTLFDLDTGTGNPGGQEHELLSKWAEDETLDKMFLAGSHWQGSTFGETWSVYEVNSFDIGSLFADVYSVGGQFLPADYALTGDIIFDNDTNTLIASYVPSGVGSNDFAISVYRSDSGSRIQEYTAFTAADVDIPLMWQDPRTGECRYGSGQGKILCSFRDTDGYPTTAPPYNGWFGTVDFIDATWDTLATVTGNLHTRRQHDLGDCSDYSVLRMNVYASLGSGTDTDVSFQWDVHDAHNDNLDNFLFAGDSVIDVVAKSVAPGGSAWTNSIIAEQVHAVSPAHFPVIQNGGMNSYSIVTAESNKTAIFGNFEGKYVVLMYGLDSATNSVTSGNYNTALTSILGTLTTTYDKIVILPTLFSAGGTTDTSYIIPYNAVIGGKINGTTILGGPDFFALSNNGIAVSGGLPSTQTAYEAMQDVLARWIVGHLYAPSGATMLTGTGRAFSAVTLPVTAKTGGSGGTVSIPALPLISEGMAVVANNDYGSTNAASNAVDSSGATTWRSVDVPGTGSSSRYLAFPMAGLTTLQKQHLLLYWRNDLRTADYWYDSGNLFYTNPVDYTIQGHKGGTTDAFSDFDATPLSEHVSSDGYFWSDHPFTSGPFSITSNRAVPDSESLAVLGYVPTSANYTAQVDVIFTTLGSDGYAGLLMRASPTSTPWYFISYSVADAEWKVEKTGTGLIGSASQTITANTPYTLKVVISGSSTTSIQVWVNGSLLTTVTDTTSPHTAAGRAGIAANGQSTSVVALDNFSITEDVSSAPPSSGWSTISTVTGNAYNGREHGPLDVTPYQWVRMNVTSSRGEVSNTDVSLQAQLHDASAGNEDHFLFLGDEIIGEVARVAKSGGAGAWTGGNLAQKVHSFDSAHYPLVINGGTTDATMYWAQNHIGISNNELLDTFLGKYVVLHYGTNDAANNEDQFDFRGWVSDVINYCLSTERIVILPTLLKRTDDVTANSYVIQYNNYLRSIKPNGTTVLAGPDFYEYVNNGTIALSGDGLHPTTAGYDAMQTIMADWIVDHLYGSEETSAVFTGETRFLSGLATVTGTLFNAGFFSLAPGMILAGFPTVTAGSFGTNWLHPYTVSVLPLVANAGTPSANIHVPLNALFLSQALATSSALVNVAGILGRSLYVASTLTGTAQVRNASLGHGGFIVFNAELASVLATLPVGVFDADITVYLSGFIMFGGTVMVETLDSLQTMFVTIQNGVGDVQQSLTSLPTMHKE